MFKQATVDDNPAGICSVDSDLIGLTQKNRNKKRGTIQRKMLLNFGVLYFGWPNQPSSGTMTIYIRRCVYVDMTVS